MSSAPIPNTRAVRGSAIATEAVLRYVGIGAGLGIGIGIVYNFFQMFVVIAGLCFLTFHFAEACYKRRLKE